jgi:predicted RNA-binding protein with PUA-like domain
MAYWLMKSEPDEVSIDDLAAAPGKKLPWFGVRNYQARNFMRDRMKVGDLAFFYHSSCPQPGIAGICKIASTAYPDDTQFEPGSPYFDKASKRDAPRWLNVDVRFVRKTRLLGLDEMRDHPDLAEMLVLKRGNRLSITPVSEVHWALIEAILARPAAL